jgi:hypothetical protein
MSKERDHIEKDSYEELLLDNLINSNFNFKFSFSNSNCFVLSVNFNFIISNSNCLVFSDSNIFVLFLLLIILNDNSSIFLIKFCKLLLSTSNISTWVLYTVFIFNVFTNVFILFSNLIDSAKIKSMILFLPH